jgi:hypothetical protein
MRNKITQFDLANPAGKNRATIVYVSDAVIADAAL